DYVPLIPDIGPAGVVYLLVRLAFLELRSFAHRLAILAAISPILFTLIFIRHGIPPASRSSSPYTALRMRSRFHVQRNEREQPSLRNCVPTSGYPVRSGVVMARVALIRSTCTGEGLARHLGEHLLNLGCQEIARIA